MGMIEKLLIKLNIGLRLWAIKSLIFANRIKMISIDDMMSTCEELNEEIFEYRNKLEYKMPKIISQ